MQPSTAAFTATGPIPARVALRRALCDGVVLIELEAADGRQLPEAGPGSHIDLHLGDGRIRQYSVCNPPGMRARYRIAVQREADGRGGSQFVHEALVEGALLAIGAPRNAFPLTDASRYLFIAGGIGITPLLAMAYDADRRGLPFRLLHLARSPERTPFREEAAAAFAQRIHHEHDQGDPARGLDLAAAIGVHDAGALLYCCGPEGLMRAVEAAALARGWPSEALRFESFAPAGPIEGERPFLARIASTGEALAVGPETTLLTVLRDAGYFIDSACEQGVCGTCRVGVLDGEPDHRDQVLSEAERAAGNVMCSCCSRACGAELTLDL